MQERLHTVFARILKALRGFYTVDSNLAFLVTSGASVSLAASLDFIRFGGGRVAWLVARGYIRGLLKMLDVPIMGVRFGGTLGDIDLSIRSPLREPQARFRRVPFKGSPSNYLRNQP